MFLIWSFKFFLSSYFLFPAAHSEVLLKAESMADKVEWMNKIRNVIQPSKGPMKGASTDGALRQSHSDGSLVSY